MAEYIEREAVMDALLHEQYGYLCEDAINSIPAAYVRPVVRGRWQPWKQDRPPLKWYSCDYCGFHALNKSNFCPNCGADMKEEN